MQNPVLKNVESGQIIELVKSPFSIGRGLACDYVIEDKTISRTHCSFIKTEEGWTLADSSTNGTLVNDGHHKGEISPVLKHNDEISLGYNIYTYTFLTVVEEVPNCPLEKLKSHDAIVKGNTTSNNLSSPTTPNSFDENGVSDDLLNDLADNMLNTVEQVNNESHAGVNIPVENLDEPTTSKRYITFHKTDKDKNISEVTPGDNVVTSDPSKSYTVDISQSNIRGNNLGQAASAGDSNCDTCGQEGNSDKETNKQNNSDETTDSPSNSSINTIIYSLADELIPEMPQPVKDNREEQASNMNVTGNMSAGTRAAATIESTSGTSASVLRDVLAESIEALLRKFSEESTVNSITAIKSLSGALLVTSTSNTATAATSSVSLASPTNVNKKIKVMAVSNEDINQLRPVAGQELTACKINADQQVKRRTRNEMKINLAPQQGDKLTDVPSTSVPKIGQDTSTSSPTASRNQRGRATTASGSSHVSTTSHNSPGRIACKKLLLEGMRRCAQDTNIPIHTRNLIKKGLHDYDITNSEASSSSTSSSSMFATVTGNTTVQNTENHTMTAGIKCHNSQEPGTSKAAEKISLDNKQNNQNKYEEIEDELMCTICASLFIKAVTLGCSHSFCEYCIEQWKKKKTDCPICRSKITSTTRTLVLDNFIEKMLETATHETKEERDATVEERKKIEEEETARKNANKRNTRGGRRGARGNVNTRGIQRNDTANNEVIHVRLPVITITDSPSTTDSDNSDTSSDNTDVSDYDDHLYTDEWYNGRRGAYYGGYGRCYKCGGRGHWANGCLYR